MGWSIGYDSNWHRDIGYGVPAFCDHPKCNAEIDRGLSYVCGGEHGCGLYFCAKHLYYRRWNCGQQCLRCASWKPSYKRPSPEHPTWIHHKLTDESWAQWRSENPSECEKLNAALSRVTPVSVIRSQGEE